MISRELAPETRDRRLVLKGDAGEDDVTNRPKLIEQRAELACRPLQTRTVCMVHAHDACGMCICMDMDVDMD